MDAPASEDAPTILIADDELHVRSLLTRVFEHRQYSVLEAADGRAALALLRDLDRPIHLLGVCGLFGRL